MCFDSIICLEQQIDQTCLAIFKNYSAYTLTVIYVFGITRCIDEHLCEDSMNKQNYSAICKALSDENRLKIVEMLKDGELCGCNMLDSIVITQPTLSHHMKVLNECGLVKIRKDSKWCHYSLNCETLTAFREYINSLTCVCNTKKKGCEGK